MRHWRQCGTSTAASTFAWLTKEVLGQRSSYLGHVKSLAVAADGRTALHFRGTVSLPELQSLYQQADLLILPSIWQESYGLPVAEAMASGVPVLATRFRRGAGAGRGWRERPPRTAF